MLGKPGTDEYRVRVAMVFGLLGVLLILSAWGMWVVRESDIMVPPPLPTPNDNTAASDTGDNGARIEAARALPLLLLFIFFVVLTVLVGSFVIVRAIRRHRDLLEHERPPPTDSSDVWARHRVPDYDDENDEDDESL